MNRPRSRRNSSHSLRNSCGRRRKKVKTSSLWGFFPIFIAVAVALMVMARTPGITGDRIAEGNGVRIQLAERALVRAIRQGESAETISEMTAALLRRQAEWSL